MKAKALVTGGCGFLGQYFVRHLLESGWHVRVLDDLSSSSPDALPTDPRLEVTINSVLNYTAVRDAAEGADLVLHLAGIVGMRLATSHSLQAYAIATKGTANVINATDTGRLVLFSSSAVYGIDCQEKVAESYVCDNHGTLSYDGGDPGYATGKLHLEELGLTAFQKGRQILILRPFNVVGPGQSGHYGMVVPTFVQLALHRRPIAIYSSGRQTRSFSEINCFVDASMKIIHSPSAWRIPYPIINIGNPESTAIAHLADTVKEVCMSRMPHVHVPYDRIYPGKRDVQSRSPDVTRMTHLIGSVQWPSIESIVRSVAGFERRRTRQGENSDYINGDVGEFDFLLGNYSSS